MDKIFFKLLLVLLPVQLGYHFWPEWSMVLGRRIDYLSPTVFVTDLLIILLFLFWRPKKIPRPLFAVVGFAAINIFFAASPLVSLVKWLKIFEFLFLGLYIVQTKPKREDVIFFLSIGVLYSSCLAILQFIFQRSVGLWILGERTFSAGTPGIALFDAGRLLLRSYATFPHPNVLGGFLAVLLPTVLLTGPAKHRVFYIATYVLGAVALVLTFSRSAWTVAVLGISLVLVKKRHALAPLIVLAACIFFAYTAASVGIHEESVVVRNELNASAVAMFLQSPLVGVGLGNFLVNLPDTITSRSTYFLQPAHNMYLLLLAETGIIGLGAALMLLLKSFRKLSPVVLILLLGLVDHYPVTLQQGQLLLTVMIATMAL